MQIEIIVAMDQHNVIGHRQTLPWHLRADLMRFKQLTTGHSLLMGRKTFESIGRVLPNRHHLILSRTLTHMADCHCFAHLDAALKFATQLQTTLFVIGGHAVFEAALPLAHTLHLTRVHAQVTGDVYFPDWQTHAWEKTASFDHPADAENEYAMTFETHHKRLNT